MKRLNFISLVIALSFIMLNVQAESVIENLPKTGSKNKVYDIGKPVAKDMNSIKDKIHKEKLYAYTAIFAGRINTINKKNVTTIKWNCKEPKVCTAKVKWPVPSIQSCHQLAKSKGQRITSYGHQTKKLSISQLTQCNRGIEITTRRSGVNKPDTNSDLISKDKQVTNSLAKKKRLIKNSQLNSQSFSKVETVENQPSTIDGKSNPTKEKHIDLTYRRFDGTKLNKDITVNSDVHKGDVVINKPANGGLMGSKNKLLGKVSTERETILTTSQQLEITMRRDKFEKFKADLERRAEEARRRAIENERRRRNEEREEARKAESLAAIGRYGVGDYNRGQDCDDRTPSTHPGATEVCDGVDNDCDGSVDEGVLRTYYLDADGDLHGNPDERLNACGEDSQLGTSGHWLSAVGNDCDDTDPDRWHDCEE